MQTSDSQMAVLQKQLPKKNALPRSLLLLLMLGSSACFAADRYLIDPEHTFSYFEYNHWGLSKQRSRFDTTTGSIEIDQDTHSGSIDIEIDAASVSTGSDRFNQVMRSGDFFDAANYPKISFKSSSLHFEEQQLTKVDGDLTIKGITHPVTLEISNFNCRFMLAYGKQACGANGSAKILRSDYKLARYVPFVSDAVTLHISVEAIKEYSKPAPD
ncbi:Polyisoprenoid-binding protein YceI [Collimonas sp. OK307]|uniref:YceI family protein n=1 Tax=Collimonas sp. OK307 TaxID=1801620 RepID=UPI0008E6B2D8|nr:YceI family protein [Collimonas sp. OK307]SFH64051.1 Polyisoprenoid-binding protein YceI [Collimonas sp. OK307]